MYLKVQKKDGESVRRRLLSQGALDMGKTVVADGEHLLFPVLSEPDFEAGELVEYDGPSRQQKPRSLRQALRGRLPDDEFSLLPSSYNIVGDIALLELDERLMPKRRLICETLMSVFKNIKVAAVKIEQVGGEYRVPVVEVVAGENRTETLHREHGCVYRLDVAKAYFSPRLGSERMRVAEQIRDGERVLVLFAGVGPYAILSAKMSKADVTAVELNPKALEYMRDNVRRNKVKVTIIEGDARAILPTIGRFERIIMPLPKQADTFLDVTLPALKPGGVVHYYTFAHDTDEATDHLLKSVQANGRKALILGAVSCGSYSPCMDRICVDFTLL